MKGSTSKEKVLKNIRRGLMGKTEPPFQKLEDASKIFPEFGQDSVVRFAEKFTGIGGKLIFEDDETDLFTRLEELIDTMKWKKVLCPEKTLFDHLKNVSNVISGTSKDLEHCDAVISTCESLIARTGSIIVSNLSGESRKATVLPPVHIVWASTAQIVNEIADGIKGIQEQNDPKINMFSLVSGPSRTADIEKTLVLGAHGPKELFLLLHE